MLRLSLFWKIFIWFLLATVLLIGLTLILVLSNYDVPRYFDIPAGYQEILNKQVDSFKSRRRPPPHLLSGFHVALVDENGLSPRANREVPQVVTKLHNQYLQTQQAKMLFLGRQHAVGPKQVQLRGRTLYLYLVQDIGRWRVLAHRHFLKSLSGYSVLALLVTAVFMCLLLSWYISRPIKKLSYFSRQFADGQLTQPVIQQVGHKGDEIGALARDFEAMGSKISQTIETQKQLISDVSHELRSPLARLQVALELARVKVGEQVANELDRITLESERLNQMIGNLLQIAALERGSIHEQRQRIDLTELLQSLVEDANFEAQQKMVNIELNIQYHACIEGYYQLLSSAIENVIRNAIRHAPEQSQITVLLKNYLQQIVIEICDSGPGIEAQHLQRIFEPFFRPEQARTRETGGAGLGLAIAKRALAAHQGTISANNRSEGGLCITFCFPEP